MAVLTKSEFQNWLENPVTKALKARIKKDIMFMQEMLIEAELEDVKGLQGRCKASINLLDVSYEDLFE